MKTVRLIFAILAALWTLGVVVRVVFNLGRTRGLTEAAGGLAAIAIMLVITVWLFQGVIAKPQPPTEDSN